MSDFVPKNGIRIARSKYHVTLSVTSRWCYKHSMQFEHSIVLLLLSFLRDRNNLIPRFSCLLSRSTSLFSTTISCFIMDVTSRWCQTRTSPLTICNIKMAQLQALITSSALIQYISNFEIVYFKQHIFQPYRKKNSCHMHFKCHQIAGNFI